MKRRIIVASIIAILLAGAAFGEANPWLLSDTLSDWYAIESAEQAAVPEGLTEREAEIYRAGYANGHYDARHPAYQEGVYVLNTKTKKFHLTNCSTTLTIAIENRAHSTLTPEELMEKNYSPCGQCHPDRKPDEEADKPDD